MKFCVWNTLLSFVLIIRPGESNPNQGSQNDTLMLRVPSDIKDHIEALKNSLVTLPRKGRQEEPLKQNPNPPGIDGPLSTSPVIAPGVYSCGHQV